MRGAVHHLVLFRASTCVEPGRCPAISHLPGISWLGSWNCQSAPCGSQTTGVLKLQIPVCSVRSSLQAFAGSTAQSSLGPHRELADPGSSSTFTGESRRERSAQCPRSRNACRGRRLRTAPGGALCSYCRGSAAQARTLGHCRLGWQRQ